MRGECQILETWHRHRVLYYFYVQWYLSYANMAWGNTQKPKLHKKHLNQKHAIRLICNENKFRHARTLMQSLKVLNVSQIKIQKILVFMHHANTFSDAPTTFATKFTYPFHKYPTHFSKNFALAKIRCHNYKLQIN